MRLVQLMGDGIEELWNFPDDTTDEQIQEWYKEFEDQTEDEDGCDLFNEFIEDKYPNVSCDRVFVDEIYV